MRQLIRTRLRRALVGIPLSIVMVLMGVSISGCASLGTMFQPTAAEKAAAPKRVPTGAEKFANASDALTGSLEAAAKALKSGKRDAKALAGIAQFAKQLPELDRGVQADFAKTRGILGKIKSAEKDAIQVKVEKQYAERQKTLASKLRTIASAESTAALRAAVTGTAKWIDDITPDAPYQPLGTELPHRIVNANAGPPVLGASIAPAYAPNLKGAEPSTLPVTPTPEDTTQTVEVQFTDDISSLVTSLGADPVRMYEYVRNTIDFEPYYGSRKGANETLLEGSGNDMDTASLLIALYRKAGIPARYVSGVVDVPIAKAMNWVGVETPEAAVKLFASGGVPSTGMLSGGKVKAVRIQHTWAEAYVAYEDYRGAGAGTGPKRWVPLDASFKEYRRLSGNAATLPVAAVSVDATGIVSAAQVDTATGQVSGLDLTAIDTVFDQASTDASAYAQAHAAQLAQNPVLDRRLVVRSTPGLLPLADLAGVAHPVSVSSEFASMPTALTESVSLCIGGVRVERPLATLVAKRIALAFASAEDSDFDMMAEADGIADVPAYLVRVRPMLLVDDKPLLAGAPVMLGSHQELECVISGPAGDTVGKYGVTAGSTANLTLDQGSIPQRRVDDHLTAFKNGIDSLATGNIDCDRLAAFVTGVTEAPGSAYFAQTDEMKEVLRSALGVRGFRMPSAGVTGVSTHTSQILGTPFSVAPSGVFIDVKQDTEVAVASGADQEVLERYSMLSALTASAFEGAVWSVVESGRTGASTVSVLLAAIEQGVPIAQIDQSNVGPATAALSLPASVIEDIREAVGRGCEVVTPVSPVQVENWAGAGYLVRDPSTLAVGCLLASGRGGGEWDFVKERNDILIDLGTSTSTLVLGMGLDLRWESGTRRSQVWLAKVMSGVAIFSAINAAGVMCDLYCTLIDWIYCSKQTATLTDDQKFQYATNAYSAFAGWLLATISITSGLILAGLGVKDKPTAPTPERTILGYALSEAQIAVDLVCALDLAQWIPAQALATARSQGGAS